MNDALRMQISAFVDGELPDNESELLLRRLSQDGELRQQVAHYLELGRAMRGEAELSNMGQLRGRIAESLGEEPPAAATVQVSAGNRLVKPLAGFAVAASVALLAIFGLQQLGVQDADEPAAPAVVDVDSDRVLDEMFRRHGNAIGGPAGSGILGELASFEINGDEVGLVQIEPKAELIAPTRIETVIDEEESDAEKDDAE